MSPSSISDMELDRISDLPGNVVDQILSYLPIKDAVKTSVLSTKWQYKYTTSPSLVFDDQTFLDDKYKDIDKLVSVVDRVLLLHSGPIHKFELFSLAQNGNVPAHEVKKWILHLSRHQLKVFVFRGFCDPTGNLPSSMFSFESLTHLELSYCCLRPPSTFRGFKNLKSLRLNDVECDECVLTNFISSLPLLEILTMIDLTCYDEGFDDFYYICIDSPNLQQLSIRGYFNSLDLKNTPHLTTLSIDKRYLDDEEEEYTDVVYMLKLLAAIPQIQRLHFGSDYLGCNDDIPRDFSHSALLVNLHHLSIGLRFAMFKETSCLLGLLKCVPHIQELHIHCIRNEPGMEGDIDHWETDNWNGPFTCLRNITICDLHGHRVEMEFINFMLLTSLTLEKMTVCFSFMMGYIPSESILIELLSFSRASTKAKIIFTKRLGWFSFTSVKK